MKDQLQTIRAALTKRGWATEKEAAEALTAVTQLEAMVGEPSAYLYASIAGPVVLHLLQQIGHAKPLYFQDQLENDLKAQTEYPDAHSCVPLYAGPAAQQPQAPTESVLIDGIAYDTPAPVAAELLRLHLELKQPQAEAVPVVTDAMALAFHRALTDGAIGQSEVEEIKVGLRAALAGHQANAVAWRARDANGRWMYGDLPAPDLPAGEPGLLAPVAPQQAEAVPPTHVLADAERLRGLHRMTTLIGTPAGAAYQRAMDAEMKKVYDALCGDLSKSTIEQYRQVLDAGLSAATKKEAGHE